MRCPHCWERIPPCACDREDDPELEDYLRREDEEMISFIQESEEE